MSLTHRSLRHLLKSLRFRLTVSTFATTLASFLNLAKLTSHPETLLEAQGALDVGSKCSGDVAASLIQTMFIHSGRSAMLRLRFVVLVTTQ